MIFTYTRNKVFFGEKQNDAILANIAYILFVIFLSFNMWRALQLRKNGIETSAIILEKEESYRPFLSKSRHQKSASITYKFKASNYQEYKSTISIPDYNFYKINIGSSIKIIFDPQNPDHSDLKSQPFLSFKDYFLNIVVATLILVWVTIRSHFI